MKTNFWVHLIIFFMITASMSGCAKSDVSPTPPGFNLIQTEIAIQVSVGLTQTAAALAAVPTDTEIPPTEAPTELPPTLAIATLEQSQSAVEPEKPPQPAQEAQPTAQSDCTYRAELYYDSIKDGTIILAGKTFKRIWDLKNIGTCTWPVGTYLRFIGGELLGADSVQPFVVTAIPPGGRVRVETIFVADKLKDYSTTQPVSIPFSSNWMIATPDGRLFGLGADGKGFLWTKINIANEKYFRANQ